MIIVEYSEDIKLDFSAAAVALGIFDGVHKGHRALLKAAKEEALKREIPLVVFTFFSENELPKGQARLYSSDIKNELLEKCGAEYTVYADFNKISNLNAESFVEKVLIDKLKADIAVTGLDFRFGKGRLGDINLLRSIMQNSGKSCLTVPDEELRGKKVSTSLIKESIGKGQIKLANELLVDPYFIEGKIIRGDGRGKSLGTPTVNVSLQNNKDFIKHGVYHSRVIIGKKSYTGLTNIGICPTFEKRKTHAETFIIDFSEDVYEETARIYLLDYLREEHRFESENELSAQIKRDIETVKSKEKEDYNGR